jgi:RNA polymerase-binding transcription factor DksA
MGSGETRRTSPLTPQERGQVCRRLEHERDRTLQAILREAAETGELLRRRGERDPCAHLSPTSSQDDADLVERTLRASGSMQALREIEQALRRLEEEPAGFGVCDRCECPIAMERLELVPATRICGTCAGSTEGKP